MAPSAKRRTRLVLIASVVAALSGAAVGAYALRGAHLDAEARRARDEGRAALRAGNPAAAVRGLGQFLRRFEATEATGQDLLDYAVAIRQVPKPNRRHLSMAVSILRRAVELDPDLRAAQDELLDVYREIGFATEALQLVERMLAAAPDDTRLLREKRDWLDRQRQFDPALAVARRINDLEPASFIDYVRTWRILSAADATTEEVGDWISAAAATHPGDARFDAIHAAELLRRERTDDARPILDRLAAAPADGWDAEFVLFLVRVFDSAGRFADGLALTERAEPVAGAALRLERCRRLWFARKFADVVRATEGLPPEDGSLHPELLALTVLSLRQQGDDDAAAAARSRMSDTAGVAAEVWRIVLDQLAAPGPAAARAIAEAVRQHPDVAATSAVLQQVYGDAVASMGEPELAMRAWQTASLLAPSWAAPLSSLARAMPGSLSSEAVSAAHAALRRDPTNAEVIRTLVEVVASRADDLDPAERVSVVSALSDLEGAAPEFSLELLPAHVGLLAEGDRGEAERRLRSALSMGSKASQVTLLRLARAARDAGIPLESDFLDLAESVHGVTPQLAAARAVAVRRRSGNPAGLAAIDELRKRRAPGTSDLDWDLVRAGYLDVVASPDAVAAWASAADGNPDSLAAQLGVLSAATTWSDRELVDRAIDRVRVLVGDAGTTWRVARARWILEIQDADESKVAEADGLLAAVLDESPANVQACVLRAQALERLGQPAQAVEQLTTAAVLAPTDARVSLELARLAQRVGDPELALRHLERALATPDLPREHAERAAFLLATRGDLRRSADLLEPLAGRAETGRESLVLLAKLYAQLGQPQRALAICDRLLASPTADVIELAAGLRASLGDTAAADALLVRLDRIDVPQAERDAVRARHASRWGEPRAAVDLFRKAADAETANAARWIDYLRSVVAFGDTQELSRVLSDPRAAEVEPVRFLRSIREDLPAALADERLRPLIEASIADVAGRPVLIQAARDVVRGWGTASQRPAVADSVRRAASSAVRLLPLQVLAVRLCAESGDLLSAGELARATMAAFPSSADAAARAYEVFARAERWEEALDAASRWRSTAEARDVRPDVALARLRLRLDRPVEAQAGLETAVQVGLARPEDHEELLVTYVLACVRSGNATRARDVLVGLGEQSPRWRTLVLDVGASWMGSASDAAAWLNVCSAIVPADDTPSRLRLARAWGAAWEVFREPVLLDRALEILSPHCSGDAARADALFIRATLRHRAGNAPDAAADYAAVLALDSESAPALNNLAMLLVDGGDWRQAVTRATRAAEIAPRRAQYVDTLAYAYRRGGEFDRAMEAHARACDLEPDNPEWLVGWLETCVAADATDRRTQVRARLDQLVGRGIPIRPDVRARIERIRGDR